MPLPRASRRFIAIAAIFFAETLWCQSSATVSELKSTSRRGASSLSITSECASPGMRK